MAHDSGSYVANITVQVTQASGVDVTLITSPESAEVTIVVAELAHQLGVKAADLIRKLMDMGSMITQNQAIDFAGVIMKHPLTDEIWMRVNSKSNPISQISTSIDSAITAVNDLKNIASKIKIIGSRSHSNKDFQIWEFCI